MSTWSPSVSTCSPRRITTRSCATGRRRNSRRWKSSVTSWASGTWHRGRWCGLLITPTKWPMPRATSKWRESKRNSESSMRKTLLLVALLTAAGGLSAKPADTDSGSVLLKPTEQQAQAATWAARFLTRFHYKAVALDDAMSEMIFDTYFQNLDGDRLFFLQSDLDKFASARTTLDDAILNKDLRVTFAIFNLYEKRVHDRTVYSRELLKKGFDFTADESYNYDREKTPWAKDAAELDDVWRKRVMNDWLRLKLANKKDDEIRTTLDKRYANYADRVHQISGEDAFQTFMNAYATAIEPHTNYLRPRASENFDIAMRLSLEGIGAVLQRDEEYTAIREIVPGGPAAVSDKLKVGDRIVGVGQGTAGSITDGIGWRLDYVVDQIRGTKYT